MYKSCTRRETLSLATPARKRKMPEGMLTGDGLLFPADKRPEAPPGWPIGRISRITFPVGVIPDSPGRGWHRDPGAFAGQFVGTRFGARRRRSESSTETCSARVRSAPATEPPVYAGPTNPIYTPHAWLGHARLFSGEGGTGKAMAAGVTADTLRYDLCRVEPLRAVNRCIGGTEKNLKRRNITHPIPRGRAAGGAPGLQSPRPRRSSLR